MSNIDERSKLLLKDDFEKLHRFKIALIGVGGVGSIVAQSMIRSGIKHLLIVDFDKVTESNLNRQISYVLSDVGKTKVDALKAKLLNIRNEANIIAMPIKLEKTTDLDFLKGYDYVVDCIDDIEGKVKLISYCEKNNINIVSSLGMGNKLDPTKVKILKLNKTTVDPLAKKLRYMLKQDGVDLSKVDVAFSDEVPLSRGTTVSSMIFVPNAAGLALSSFVIRKLLSR